MALTETIERELREANRELLEENRRLKAEVLALRGAVGVSTLSYADLLERAERLNLVIEATQAGTWDWDPEKDTVAWNSQAYEMFGLEPRDAPTSFANTAERIHPDDVFLVRLALLKHLNRGERFGIDLRARQADGSYRWVHCCGRTLRDRKGKPQRVIGLLLDVNERKQNEIGAVGLSERLHVKVSERERELQLARQELEEFCYAVSHDLRTPLRSINGFSKAIQSEYGDKLDALGHDYLDRVQKASLTLADLLDNLLAMVRISRVEVHPADLDLTDLAQSIASEFTEGADREVDVEVQTGMQAFGDVRLIRLLLTNLFSNAWKFTSNTAAPRIQIGEEDGVFFIRDNGAGFDMQYSDMLYKPFQRLHASARFPGSGIGLTIAQRIAARHGGRLWGESTGEEQGATFYFELPSERTAASGESRR